MTRLIVTLFITLIYINLVAKPPDFSLTASGGVYDFVVDGNILYAATDKGIVDVFNILTKRRVNQIKVPKIHDFAGDLIAPKIFSIDLLQASKQLLLTVQGEGGFSDIYLVTGTNIQKIISAQNSKLLAKRAAFFNNNTLVIGLMSNEIVLYRYTDKKQLYRIHYSTSSLSDFVLINNRTKIVTCDEAGKLRLIDTKTGTKLKELSGQNVDNIYKTAYAHNTYITAGQDRRVAVYAPSGNYYLTADFLVYAAGISPLGKLGAYSATALNEIQVFEIHSKQKIQTLVGQKSTLTKIFFRNEKQLITSSEDPQILFWNL